MKENRFAIITNYGCFFWLCEETKKKEMLLTTIIKQHKKNSKLKVSFNMFKMK
jgi:hypothetical protein